ncbi:MAG TPA: transposase [Gammaproteobacteria bacterium]|nr:transposase [Gammaproteobacteria bacterium]
MARLPRFVLPGQPQHVIQRGNNREEIFCAEADYRFYLGKLAAAVMRHDCEVHAYVLMTNHVHLLMTPHAEPGIGKALQMLGHYYVQYYNHCYRRTGTLWEGRYRATLIDGEAYLLTCMRYIELNPCGRGWRPARRSIRGRATGAMRWVNPMACSHCTASTGDWTGARRSDRRLIGNYFEPGSARRAWPRYAKRPRRPRCWATTASNAGSNSNCSVGLPLGRGAGSTNRRNIVNQP